MHEVRCQRWEGYVVAKNLQVVYTPVEPVVFQPPPFDSAEDERLNGLCQVRALWLYWQRAAAGRKTSQLFVSYGPGSNRNAVAVATISRWIVEAAKLAYTSSGVQIPEGLGRTLPGVFQRPGPSPGGFGPGDFHGGELVVSVDLRGFLQPGRGGVCGAYAVLDVAETPR